MNFNDQQLILKVNFIKQHVLKRSIVFQIDFTKLKNNNFIIVKQKRKKYKQYLPYYRNKLNKKQQRKMRQQSSQIFQDLSAQIDISKNIDTTSKNANTNSNKNISTNSKYQSQVSHYDIQQNNQQLARSRSEITKMKVTPGYLMSPMQQLDQSGKKIKEKQEEINDKKDKIQKQDKHNKIQKLNNPKHFQTPNLNRQPFHPPQYQYQQQQQQQQQANIGGWICQNCLTLRNKTRALRSQITTLRSQIATLEYQLLQKSNKLNKFKHDITYLSKEGIKYGKIVLELQGKLREKQEEYEEEVKGLRKQIEDRNQRYIIIQGQEYYTNNVQKQKQKGNNQQNMTLTKKPSLSQNRRGKNPSTISSDQQQILDSLIKQFQASRQQLQQKSKQNLTIQQILQKHLINYVIQLNKGTKAKIKGLQQKQRNQENNTKTQSQIQMQNQNKINEEGIKDYIQYMLKKEKQRIKEFVENFHVMIGENQEQKQKMGKSDGNQGGTWCAYKLLMNMIKKKSA